jgi:deoxyribonuclease-4
MGRIGAHVSVSGGISHSIARARSIGCESFQIFTRNQRQWSPPQLDEEEAISFKKLIGPSGLGPVVSHGSYLMNLASPDEAILFRTIDALKDEMKRCIELAIDRLVVHPGAHKGSGIQKGLKTISGSIDQVLNELKDEEERKIPTLLLETTAGSGTGLGSKFQEIAEMIDVSSNSKHLGVCLDTAHMHGAGYSLVDEDGYESTMEEVNKVLGVEKVGCIHLNDSKVDLGSRKDRHENIGKGALGNYPFLRLVNDTRFEDIPMILETPGGDEEYKKGLSLLRSFRVQE